MARTFRLRTPAAALLLLAGAGAPARGQETAATPAASATAPAPATTPGWPFRAPTASPLEPATRLGPVHASRREGGGWVAIADIGDRIPFWIRRPAGGGPAIAAAVAGAAYSRFDLERTDNEFQEVHYRVGFQLAAHRGALGARLELYHASSHLGDELLVRTGREPVSTSREGVELLVQLEPLPGLLVHAGPGLLLRSSGSLDRPSARLGIEWRGSRLAGGPFRPFLAADAFLWQELRWTPVFASEAGLAFADGRLRVAATLGAGRSRAEQFFRQSETVAGLLFTVAR